MSPSFYLLVLSGIGVLAFWGLGTALTPLSLAFFAAYGLFPTVKWLEKHGVHRRVAVLLVVLLITGSIVLLSLLIVPPLLHDLSRLVAELPAFIHATLEKLEARLWSWGWNGTVVRTRLQNALHTWLSQISWETVSTAFGVAGRAVSGIHGILMRIMGLLMFPVFFFFLIDKFETIHTSFLQLFPEQQKKIFGELWERGNRILNGYVRGQLVVCFTLALFYAFLLYALGVQFGIVVGLATGLFTVIPYVGFSLGFASAVVIVLATGGPFWQLFGVIAVFTVAQILEGFVLTPRIVGNKVGLSIFTTMLALIIAGNLAGLPGMIIAIPAAAFMKESLGVFLAAARAHSASQY